MRDASPAIRAASLCAAPMIAYQVAGKATRDTLFLTSFGVAALPAMVVVSSVACIVAAVLGARWMSRIGPDRTVLFAFGVSALLFLAEWAAYPRAPRAVAVMLYLHIAIFGLFTVSAFWSLLNERFDPRSARRAFARIAAAAALGGFAGGLIAERGAAILSLRAMLLPLSALSVFCAGMAALTDRATRHGEPSARTHADAGLQGGGKGLVPAGLRLLMRDRYLADLAIFVILGTIVTTLIDFVFKAEAVHAFPDASRLLRFFAVFYTATGLLTYVAHLVFTRVTLEAQGAARTTSVLPLGVGVAGLGFLAFPGLVAAVVLRGLESVVRNSFFRSGYELLYTPVPGAERRAAKPIIDVGAERAGDALGAGLARAVIAAVPAFATRTLAGLAMVLVVAGVYYARRLHAGYIRSLERNLVRRGVALQGGGAFEEHASQALDLTMLRPAGGDESLTAIPIPRDLSGGFRDTADVLPEHAAEAARFRALHSDDAFQVRSALLESEPLPVSCVPAAIRLLDNEEFTRDARRALRRVAPRIIGQLVDALVDPELPVDVRRRIARVLGTTTDRRAVEGLLLGLEDWRFEVRYQCARTLSRMSEHGGPLHLDSGRVYAAVLREAAAGRASWESGGPLVRPPETESDDMTNRVVRERAGRSMEHVFTLLSLVLPRRPLQVSFQGIYSGDAVLRGTALEYLESVLPRDVRASLWPYLEDSRREKRPRRTPEEALSDLMRANPSLEINLRELRRQAEATETKREDT